MIIQLHPSDFNGDGANPVTNAINRVFRDVEWHYSGRFILSEGTGAALAMPIVEASVRILSEMALFDEAGVSRIRK